MTTKRKKNISYNPIRNIEEDWSLDDRNNKPYSGESVQAFLKDTLNAKAGDFYYDASTTKYLVFASIDDRAKYLSDRETYADLLLGSFDAPANYTAEITLISAINNAISEGDKNNYIDFTFDIKNKSGASTGESVIVTYTINNGGNVKKINQIYGAGETAHFLVDDYLRTGVNTINIVVQGRDTLAAIMTSVTYTVISLTLTSDFDFAAPIEKGDDIDIPYFIKGSGVKYIEWYVDGVQLSGVDDIADIQYSTTKHIPTTSLTEGKHNIQIRPYVTINGSNFYGKTLYFDVVVCPVDEEWDIQGVHLTYVLLSMYLAAPATSGISISGRQWETIEYEIGLYDYRRRNLDVAIKDNNVTFKTISMNALSITSEEYMPTTSGSHTISIVASEATASFGITATAVDLGVHEETEDRLLKLSAKGRNNNEVNPAIWTDGSIAATFSGIVWNEQSGWINDALVIPAGGNVTIPFAALGNTPINKGRTIEIEFEVADVDNDDAAIMTLVNSTTNAGLSLTATSAKLQSSGGAQINTKFRDGDKLHLAFIINKVTGDDAKMMYIVNNGILERAASFEATDNFNVTDNIVIGSASCIVKLYSIRVYDKALTEEQVLGNYIMDSDNIISLVNANDVLNPSTGRIDVDKVNAKIPVLKITGDMQPIFDATDKNTTVYVDVEYKNLQEPSLDFTAEHTRMRPQGTSSLGYPRKNLRMYTSSAYGCVMKDGEGNVIENGKYSFRQGAQPVDCWTFKADYAESSGSHNTGVARLWNKLLFDAQVGNTFPLRTAAQAAAVAANYKYDVRTAIDGFPVVIFYRPDTSSEYICLGQYNFNNDKSTESVFGFKDIPGFDNTNVQCFEVLGNEEPLALFTDVSDFDTDWSDAFESRYPDTKTPNLTPLKTLCTWVNACANDQEKWEEEKADHFDIPKLAAYYVYLMRFGAVDQTVKNSMLTTEDGVHWFFINYDNDTVIGIDNISTVLNSWNYDRTTQKAGGSYIYAGHNSVLWNCFEADEECMAMVKNIDNALYSAGLTYANLLKTFDEEQCDKWCERIYNDNGRYKYIAPFKEKGAAVLYMLQGSRKSYRHWWLKNRMEMFDAMWATAAYTNRVVRFIAEGAPSGSKFTIGASKASYFGYGINAVVQESGVSVAKNGTHEFTIAQALAIGDPINIYNANNVNKVDLSKMCQYLTTLYMQYALDNNGNSVVKQLILGDGTATNVKFTEIGGMTTANALEEIDIRNFTALTTVNLTAQKNLHIFKAAGSGLTSFAPAAGCTLTTVTLPASVQSIVLDGCNVTNFTVTDYTVVANSALRNVTMKNLSGTFDTKSFVFNWIENYEESQLANFSLTLSGINWNNVSVTDLIKLGKIGTKNLQGEVTITSMTLEQYNTLVDLFGANAFKNYGTFRINAPAGVYLTGPTSLKFGKTGTYTATAFPATEDPIKYLLYDNNNNLITAQTDGQGRVYRTSGGVTLYEATGAVSVSSSITSDATVKVRARVGTTEVYSTYITLQAIGKTYPSSLTISGNSSIDQNGFYNYTKAFNTNNFTVDVKSVAWSLTSNNACTISAQDASGATLQVTNTPSTTLNVTLTCLVTFEDDTTMSATKSISLCLTYPSSVTLSGPASITDNGTYEYTKSFNTNNFTASVLSVNWTLTSNQFATITTDNNKATIGIANGNDNATTLTLTCTVTLSGNVTRSASKEISVAVIAPPPTEDWVDLGLPSGLLWCRHNVGAENPEDAGLYFAWGETTGYADAAARNTALGRSDGFSGGAYIATGGAAITDSVLTLTHDAAQANMGLDWRMPRASEIQELVDNTDMASVIIGTQNCIKFMKKTDHSVYIIIPQCQCYNGNNRSSVMVLSSDYSDINHTSWCMAIQMNNSGTGLWVVNTCIKSYGSSVRAVREAPKAIDLGLPSGTFWCDRMVGAMQPGGIGLEFSYGNTDGHKIGSFSFTQENYENTQGKDLWDRSATLSGDYDAATANFKGSWRTPNRTEVEELISNTNITSDWINGIPCWIFTSKTDSTKFICIPKQISMDTGQYNQYMSSRYWLNYISNKCWTFSLGSNTPTKSSQSSYRENVYYGYQGFFVYPIQ